MAECLCAAVSVSVLVHQPITDMSKERLSVFINIDPIISASRGWPSGSQTPRAVIKLQSHSIYLQSREATEQRSHCTAHFAERAGDLHLSGETEITRELYSVHVTEAQSRTRGRRSVWMSWE